MESKSLLFGIIGFILGGLLVAVAASAAEPAERDHGHTSADDMSMTAMNESLQSKSGDAFDEVFISQMIAHHQGAVDMAKLAQQQAKHTELKELSNTILATQSKEIEMLRTWQQQWGYETTEATHMAH